MSNAITTKLPYSELRIMQAIWDLEKQGIRDISADTIRDSSPDLQEYCITTLLTLLSRLRKRGFVSVKKEGRINKHNSLVSEDDYLTFSTRYFVEKIFKGNSEGLLRKVKEL